MSSNLIFKVPGRTTNYMPINVNTSRGEIMEKYARSSFSTANDWPHDSPSAGYYDVKNSDTKLVLLNNQKTWSHLRGKTKAKHEPFKKDKNYDWVEKEIELKKNSSNESLNKTSLPSPKRVPEPDRHFKKAPNSRSFLHTEEEFNKPSKEYLMLRKKNRSAVPIKSQSEKCMSNSLDKKEEERLENEILLKYLYAVGKRTTGLQGTGESRRPPREFLSSYNINHPEFSKGQKLFLNELCSMYSVTPLKQSKQQQYIKLFKKQTDGDQKHRLKYRMHGGDNFDLYKKWLGSERPLPHEVNCGYYKPIGSLHSRSMIHKPSTSPSNSSSFVSQSSTEPSNTIKPRTAPVNENRTPAQRPVTAKRTTNQTVLQQPSNFSPRVKAKITSGSDTSIVSQSKDHSERIESKDMIKKIKAIDHKGSATESSQEFSEN